MKKTLIRTALWTAICLIICGSSGPAAVASRRIDLRNGTGGRQMDGLGVVVSYGKLLHDYDPAVRDVLMDYLFKPNFGAALQIVKVEMGYDGNNTGMSWQAHRRSLGEQPDFTRGYGWWYMQEAKKRNPDVILSALNWGYPVWAEDHLQKAQFIYEFVDGARREHGLHIDYIGGNQNETGVTPWTTVELRRLLDANGYGDVKIIAADEGARVTRFQVFDEMEKHPAYRDAVDVVGVHYKGRPGDWMPAEYYRFADKRLWSTEDGGGSPENPASAYQWVHQLMKLFIDVKMTAAIRWLSTASIYNNFPWPAGGVLRTREPWSGHYKVGSNLWAFAHFTQFVPVGWRMIEAGDSYLSGTGDSRAGRYIAYASPGGEDFSMVAITQDSAFPDGGLDVEVVLPGGAEDKPVYVWRSDFNKDDEVFVCQRVVRPVKGIVKLHLDKDCVYSVTTTIGQSKGWAPVPEPKPFPMPYADDFDGYAPQQLPKYFVNAAGVFEAQPAMARDGMALRQVIRRAPVPWHQGSRHCTQPVTQIGSLEWTDYRVSVDALLENAGKAMLGIRIDGKHDGGRDYLLQGYWLSLDERGRWELFRKDAGEGEVTVLASGQVAYAVNQWTTLELSARGAEIEARIGGRRVGSATDGTWDKGAVTLAAVSHDAPTLYDHTELTPNAQFDNFSIKP